MGLRARMCGVLGFCFLGRSTDAGERKCEGTRNFLAEMYYYLKIKCPTPTLPCCNITLTPSIHPQLCPKLIKIKCCFPGTVRTSQWTSYRNSNLRKIKLICQVCLNLWTNSYIHPLQCIFNCVKTADTGKMLEG